MRLKFTIAICALLVLGLAVAEVNAQGYKISVRQRTVVVGGHNQMVGDIKLTHRTQAQGDFNVPESDTYEITFGGLYITAVNNGGDTDFLDAGDLPYINAATAVVDTDTVTNEEKTKAGKIKFNVTTHGGSITISAIRLDVSGLAADATVMATVSATETDDDDFSNIDAPTQSTTATFKISDVKDGLNVTAVEQVSVLNCDKGIGATRVPSITVEEGFANAWETDAAGFNADANNVVDNSTHIRVVVDNVPSGVTFRWPGQGNWGADGTPGGGDDLATDASDYFANPIHEFDRDGDGAAGKTLLATLNYVSSANQDGDDKAKRVVIYQFEGVPDDGDATTKEHGEVKNVFKISPTITVDTAKTGAGGVSDAGAQLWPAAKTGDADNRATKLTYTHAVETKDEGYFVNVTECVTYLLFPFLTCGAQADWTTGIAVANTSKDDEVFPVNKGAAPQSGSVTIHAYPKSTMEEKMATGMMSSPEELADPISATISGNLAAGDTVAVTCNTDPMLAGFEGYAIARAAFRHAHGMAFVLGNFQDGAAVDVAHGYIALVVPDPEFELTTGGPQGRGAGDGESLGQ